MKKIKFPKFEMISMAGGQEVDPDDHNFVFVGDDGFVTSLNNEYRCTKCHLAVWKILNKKTGKHIMISFKSRPCER